MSSPGTQNRGLFSRLTAEDGQLRRQQLEGFARHTPINSGVSLTTSLITVLMLWNTVPKVALLGWLGMIWAIALLRLHRWRYWRARKIADPDRQARPVRAVTLHKAAAWAAVTGLLWGSSVGFHPYIDGNQQLLVMIVIAAMASGAATTLAAIPLAAAAFIICAIVPWAIYFAWIGDHMHIGLACFALVMTLAMLISASIVHRSFMEAIRTRRQNSILVRRIREERSEWLEISDTSEAFALFDEDQRLLLWNENYRRILSLSINQLYRGAKRQDLLRRCATAVSVTSGEESLDQWMERQIALGKGRKEPLVEQLSNGRWVKSIARETGRGHTATVHVDITELKQREAELLATQEELRLQSQEVQRAYDQLGVQHRKIEETTTELRRARDSAMEASRAKNEFLANMSHELRTPLNAVIGFSELLGRETFGPLGSERYEDYVRHIHESGEHLLNLINDLLDLSIIEAGELQLVENPVDMLRVVDLCTQLVRSQAERDGVTLRVTGNVQGWPLLQADGTKLRQIMLNLVSNAIKFTPAGGSVSLDLLAERGKPFIIEVTDTGIGMRREDIPAVLEPFRRLSPAHSAEYQGAGLGLPLTKALVELHGGTVEITSTPGEGTRVTVTLPEARALYEEAEQTAPAKTVSPGSA